MPSIAKLFLLAALSALALSACESSAPPEAPDGGSMAMPPDAPGPCVPVAGAPTYTQLYNSYFADGTAGHCAKSGCHGDPGHTIWLCGTSKDSCYNGMLSAGLINTKNPKASLIADPSNSPLRWFNPQGPMPADAQTPFEAARAEIAAWVTSCALNN